MQLGNLTIRELQQLGGTGDMEALAELGRRVLDMEIHEGEEIQCHYRTELAQLQRELDSEIPPECPHCGKWITEK